jgi:hypothetical protein
MRRSTPAAEAESAVEPPVGRDTMASPQHQGKPLREYRKSCEDVQSAERPQTWQRTTGAATGVTSGMTGSDSPAGGRHLNFSSLGDRRPDSCTIEQ